MTLLTTHQAANFLNLSANTLNQWRYQKKGPKFLKIQKLVRYREQDLKGYLEGQVRTGTSHQGLQSY